MPGHWLAWPILVALVAAMGCERQATEERAPAEAPVVEAPEGPPAAEPVPEAWVARRVAEAEARLKASEAGRLLWDAIEAHGGLGRWLQAGTIAFEFDYRPLGQPERRMHTENRVDLWRARAWQRELGEGADATFGFDGDTAWIVPGPDAFPTPARFWATTPYYFVGVPWVLADPGTRIEVLEDQDLGGERHHVVKVGYEAGTGDTPDDYYVAYIHPETKLVGGIRYVVSYPAFFPEGGHSPEKLMYYRELRDVDGLRVAHRYETHAYDADSGEPGERVTEVDVRRVRTGQRWSGELFAAPEGAVIDDSHIQEGL
jgi:hypothetical protein